VLGFAIPFYLAHPRLMRLERSQMLEVEGASKMVAKLREEIERHGLETLSRSASVCLPLATRPQLVEDQDSGLASCEPGVVAAVSKPLVERRCVTTSWLGSGLALWSAL